MRKERKQKCCIKYYYDHPSGSVERPSEDLQGQGHFALVVLITDSMKYLINCFSIF